MTDLAKAPSTEQTYFEDVQVGADIPSIAFPLSMYRLVMEAGANRDFNSIHHNTEYAKSTGAKEAYANTSFLLGMWERTIREWIGAAGTIVSIKGFRMRSFNYVGDTTTVYGKVIATDDSTNPPTVSLEIHCANSTGVTVGPGTVVVTVPRRS